MAPKKRVRAAKKNLQIRLGGQAHDTLRQLSDIRETSIAETIRDSIEFFAIQLSYARRGQQLIWLDEKTGTKTIVLIPGFNAPRGALLQSPEHDATAH